MKKWLLLATLLFALFIVAIVVVANLDKFPKPLKYLYDFPGGDKVGHFSLFGILSFLLNRSALTLYPKRNPARLTLTVSLLLSEIHESMLKQATEYRDTNIHDPKDYDELKEVVKDGWAFSWWCESEECEAKVKQDTKATTRIIPFDQSEGAGKCIVCGEKAEKKVYFARAY